jgi:AraC-like DNA-binding protein
LYIILSFVRLKFAPNILFSITLVAIPISITILKPHLLKVSTGVMSSFSARHDTKSDINSHWHYHPEVELIYFKKGSGTQFIGDNISQFAAGDVVLVGKNLPHYWKYDTTCLDDGEVDVYVVHFNENFWGDTFLNLPENFLIKDVLKKAERGIQVQHPNNAHTLGYMVEQVVQATGARKIMMLMDVLLAFGNLESYEPLTSFSFQLNFQAAEKDRINAIYNYSITNFKKRITLNEIASVANVSPTSFCKYFKSLNNKTYSEFINEIRIGHACKLLIENELQVKEVCYESGFHNFANFYRFFKRVTGKSPLSYQKEFLSGS